MEIEHTVGDRKSDEKRKRRIFFTALWPRLQSIQPGDDLIKYASYSLDKAFESRGCSFGLLAKAIHLHCSVLCSVMVLWDGQGSLSH